MDHWYDVAVQTNGRYWHIDNIYTIKSTIIVINIFKLIFFKSLNSDNK